MADNLPSAPRGSIGDFLTEWVSSGKIPGAVKAIAHVIGASGEALAAGIDIGKAKAEQIAQGIRDETSARSIVRAEMARQVTAILPEDQDLARRAAARWIGDEMKKQVNREEVAALAVSQLDAEPPPSDAPAPEEEWLDHFSKYAETASGDRVRVLWSKVLAGEIRKPGAVSLRTLQILSGLDKRTADVFLKWSAFVINGQMVLMDDEKRSGEWLLEAFDLDAAGLMNYDSMTSNNFDGAKSNRAAYLMWPYVIMVEAKTATQISFPVIMLTHAGRELLPIIGRNAAAGDNVDRVARAMLKTAPDSIKVSVGAAVTTSDGGVNILGAVQVV